MTHVIKKPYRGFTLIELLIVVTIIAILASLSFAVYGKVTDTARSAKSVANLKQLGSTWTMIASEGVDGLRVQSPPNYYPQSSGQVTQPQWSKFRWVDLMGEYLGYCERGAGQFDWSVDIKDTILRNPTVSTIPTYDGSDASDKDSLNFGYGLNAHLTNWKVPPDPKTRITQVKNPSQKILFGETNPDDPSQTKDLHIVSAWSGYAPLSSANKGGGNCVFIDGHCEHLKHSEVYAYASAMQNPYFIPTLEFTAP